MEKYSAILAPGKYFIEIVGLEGFKAYQKELEVLGKKRSIRVEGVRFNC